MESIEPKIVFRLDYSKQDWETDKKIGNVFLKLVKSERERKDLLDYWCTLINNSNTPEKVRAKLWVASIHPYITKENFGGLSKSEMGDFVRILGPEKLSKYLKTNWRRLGKFAGKK